ASTNAAGSNGARSSAPSPSPISLTGTPSSRWTATTMPPLAVPSSLVRTMPVMSTTSAKTRAWMRPFWPVVASSTSSTSSSGACFSTTRLTLPSSSMRPVLVCRRPAVSMSTASADISLPSLTASNATEAGSPPSGPRTMWAPTRSPQVWSWSAAAARKVSAAPSTTVLPSATSTRASLPVVVVLPVPLTPTTITTPGPPVSLPVCTVRSMSGPTRVISSSRSRPRSSSGVRVPRTFTRSRSRSTSSWVGCAPPAAVSRVSSISSQVSSSRCSRDSRESRPLPRAFCERDRRARRRIRRPSVGAGISMAGASAAGGSSMTTAEPSGRSTSSMVRRGSSRGVSASSPTCGSAGGAVMSGAAGGGGGSGFLRRLPTMSPPIAPSTTTAMTTARMTMSITRPVSAMAPPAAPTAGRPDRPCRGLAHPGHLTARQLPSVPEPPGGRWTRRREPSHARHGRTFQPGRSRRLPRRARRALPGRPGDGAYADDRGITTVQTEEHHGAADNWLPSPFVLAGAVLGATRRIAVTVSAMIGPLHDPLRLAEEIAVLDLIGGGRLVTVAGIGYRPEEYELFGVDVARRGALQDELLETLLKAWTGEEFTPRGRTVRITPRPATQPRPPRLGGGSARAAARRAARLGLPFFPSAHLPEMETYYQERLAEYGTSGRVMMPAAETSLLHVAEDPDRSWALYGEQFLHEARTYASWQPAGARSA